MDWVGEQQEVIKAAVNSRQLVNAGPGTGETFVVCTRIACIIDGLGAQPVHLSSVVLGGTND